MKKITDQQIADLACANGLEYAALKAFISVESGGIGFDPKTGKIIIQFEPHIFRKYATYSNLRDALWYIVNSNRVEGQVNEWKAFNAAFRIDAKSALLSTSIGLMQVMGFNFGKCGYGSVNDMWDDFKKGEYEQVKGAVNFIKATPKLYAGLKKKDFAQVAYYYNGANYGLGKYDIKLQAAYEKYA